MQIHETSARTFRAVVILAVIAGTAVIIAFSLISRAQLNLKAALTDKPDIAVLLLMEEMGAEVTDSELLRDLGNERDYLVETSGSGTLFIKLRKAGEEWHIAEQTPLHETD
jgi:hypothetical protein